MSMPALVIVGAQWGDEGKGKVTDYLATEAQAVVRYQGGNNAGHTIVVGSSTHKFHLIPSGMLHKDKTCILGNGVVIDPDELVRELDALIAEGVDVTRLKVSDRAHFILPTHKILDAQAEIAKGSAKIGTTGRGIGPAYQDKVNRCGVRLADAADASVLPERVRTHLNEHAASVQGSGWTEERLVDYLRRAYARIAPHITDTVVVINDMLDQGANVLFEGAQGTLLDIDHGTYPFVTSSSPTVGGACIGGGIGPTRVRGVVGVSKAYTTRVGSGPFPTELVDADGEALRHHGQEFGTTTGRPRRCGWLDLVGLRYAVRLNGISHLVITKLDVLDHFPALKVCTGYVVDGRVVDTVPAELSRLAAAVPQYQEFAGWARSTASARRLEDLPTAAVSYLEFVERFLGVPVALVSIGADRTATFARRDIWSDVRS
jgi:adenylosuccinate synthase